MPRPRQLQKQARYEVSNREAAEVILDSIEANGGEQSAVVQWARLVLSKSSGRSTSEQAEPGAVITEAPAGA